MTVLYTAADLAAAWESGYWNGTTHVGPLNDAAVAAKNPYKKKSGLDTPAKKSVQTAEETPTNEEILVNTKTTKTLGSMTVREAGDAAQALGMTFPDYLEMLGPIPMPPAGYTLAPKSEDRWIGEEKMNRGWIITPVWDGATNRRTIDLWTSRGPNESDAHLTPMEAIQLAADLIELAKNALPEDFAAGDMG